jgi:hypothetical protein
MDCGHCGPIHGWIVARCPPVGDYLPVLLKIIADIALTKKKGVYND